MFGVSSPLALELELSGLSGMISAGLAFLVVYCVLFRKRIRFDGVSAFVPVGIIFLLWLLPLSYRSIAYAAHNLLVFLISLVLAVVLVRKLAQGSLPFSYDSLQI